MNFTEMVDSISGTPRALRRKPAASLAKQEIRSAPRPPARARSENAPEAEGARRERARCSAIVLSAAGEKNPVFAQHLAFDTNLTSKEALAVLQAAGAPAVRGAFAHPERAAKNPRVGASLPPPPTQQAVGRGWDRAFAAVAPRRRP